MVNEALLTKLGWRIVSGDRTPWCSALRAKYLRSYTFLDVLRVSGSSGVWNRILASRDIVRRGTRWRIGSNSNLSFWFDT